MQTTDLVQDNKGLRSHAISSMNENRDLHHENARLRNENNELRSEVSYLKSRISDLRHEIGSIYKSTKEFLKERTSDLKTFKSVFKDLVGKVKEKTPQSEFERLEKAEKRRERNRGMEL